MTEQETSVLQECCPPPSSKPVPLDAEEQNEQLASLAKALGHPARVAIIRYLLARSSCVCGEIVGQLPLAQSTVSQHLKQLKEAGLIRGEVDGPRVCYCADRDAVARLRLLLQSLIGAEGA